MPGSEDNVAIPTHQAGLAAASVWRAPSRLRRAFDQPILAFSVVGYPHSSPRATKSRMLSTARSEIASIVRDGLTPPTVGSSDPSQIHEFGISRLRQSALTTLLRGSDPMRAVPLR